MMICKYCGAVLEDDATFCGVCGQSLEAEAPVEAPAAAPTEGVVEQPAENFFAEQPEAPKKKSKAPIIIAVIALIAVVVGVLGFVFWDDLFGGKVKEEEQLAYALTHYSEDEEMFTDKILANVGKNVAADGELTVEVSPMLTSSLGISASEITLKYDADLIPDEKMGLILSAYVGETEIATGKLYADYANNKAVIDLPGLLQKPVEIDMADSGISLAPTMTFSAIGSQTELSAEQTVAMIDALLKIAYDSLLEIPFTSETQMLTANGVSEELKCFDVKLDAATAAAFAKNFLTNVKNSAELKTAIDGLTAGMGEEAQGLYTELLKGIDEALASLNDIDTANTEVVNFKIWVDEEYTVRGIKMTDGEGEDELFFGFAQAAGKAGLDAYSKEGDTETFSVRGNGTVENGLYDMTIDVNVEGEKMIGLVVTDFACSETAVKGKVEISIDGQLADAWNDKLGGMLAAPTITVEMDIDETKSNFSVAVNMGASMQLLKVSVLSNVSDKAEVNIPTDVTTDMNVLTMIDPSAILARLEQAGVPVNDLLNMFGGLMQSGSATL